MRHSLRGLLLIAVAMFPTLVYGQSRLGGLISPEAANRVGLVRQWHTNIDLHRANARVIGVNQFVSNVTNHQVFEVVDGGKVYRFSEKDRDAFGDVIGPAGAKAKATELFLELEAAGKKPTVAALVVPDTFLYVVTSKGVVHALNAETGETLWVQSVGNPELLTTDAATNEDSLAICNGSTIYILNRHDGQVFWQHDVLGAIGAGPALTEGRVSVPMLSGNMETYRVSPEKRYPPFVYRSRGAIYNQPLTTPRNSVVWTTDKGHLNVADGSTGKARFRLETSDTIIGGAAYLAPRYIFVASFDGYVYGIDEENGNQLWRYSCGATVSKAPVAIDDTVYTVTDDGQLHALDHKTGMLKEILVTNADGTTKSAGAWPVVTGVHGVLAASPTRLYCLGGPGQLLILDVKSGRKVGILPLGAQDIVLHNQRTDRLFIGTSTGLIQCLHERHLSWPHGPLVHNREALLEAAKPVEAAPPEAAPMEEADPEPMPNNNADPFGSDKPMEADPFGGPAPPKVNKPAAEEDPFK